MRDRCGKEEKLSFFRRHADELVDFFQKACRQHLVRFIHYNITGAAETEGIAPAMIQKPSRRADDDLRPAMELLQLVFYGLTADEAEYARSCSRCERSRHGGDLLGQFACRRDDQRLLSGRVLFYPL